MRDIWVVPAIASILIVGILGFSVMMSSTEAEIIHPIDTSKRIGDFGENVEILLLNGTPVAQKTVIIEVTIIGGELTSGIVDILFTKDGVIKNDLFFSAVGSEDGPKTITKTMKRDADTNDWHIFVSCFDDISGKENLKDREGKIDEHFAKTIVCKIQGEKSQVKIKAFDQKPK